MSSRSARVPREEIAPIPVVDIFAGPGGLSEGFASIVNTDGSRSFDIRLSIEKDPSARATLKLRSFFRKFLPGKAPEDYYRYLRGEIDLQTLYSNFPDQHSEAENEAWLATLGQTDAGRVREKVSESLRCSKHWVLLGGPPCQVYSSVGRSRMKRERGDEFEADERHFMYRQYLRILWDHAPAVFIFENVKGLLSASVHGDSTFESILRDLKNPSRLDQRGGEADNVAGPRYVLYSIDGQGGRQNLWERARKPQDFVVKSERYGVPQTRHRIIVMGVRDDLLAKSPAYLPGKLIERKPVPVEAVIGDLPRLRSRISDTADSQARWLNAVRGLIGEDTVDWHELPRKNGNRGQVIEKVFETFDIIEADPPPTGERYLRADVAPSHESGWFTDPRLGGICNHVARSHMASDLQRYIYAACYAMVNGTSPRLVNFPYQLLPDHRNTGEAMGHNLFSDRFRVQTRGRPATTVTSHIAKDGHYFIHYDASQCRSLTVREAARIQTFPDNYFFEGNRTQQYIQVGNAVPPLLARQIAVLVVGVFRQLRPTTAPGTRADRPSLAIPVAQRD